MNEDRLTEEQLRQICLTQESVDPLQGFDMVINGLGFGCSNLLVDLEKSTIIVEAGLTPEMITNKLFDKCGKILTIGYKFEDDEFQPFMLLELEEPGLTLDVLGISSGRYITTVKLTGKIKSHRMV